MRNQNSCSFCGEAPREIEWMIAGPNVFICNECVDICNDTIKEKRTMTDKEVEVTINEDCKVEGNEIEMEMTEARARSLGIAMERERTDAYVKDIELMRDMITKKYAGDNIVWLCHIDKLNAAATVHTVAVIAVCTVVSLAVIFATMGG